MTRPSRSQPKNQAQLLFVIPVRRYKHVVTPIRGINEYFLSMVKTLKRIQIVQKMMIEIFGVARSMNVAFPSL
jgi:hypothetical protein